MNINEERRGHSRRAARLGRLWEHLTGLPAPMDASAQDRALTARLIKGVLLASLPINLIITAINLAFGGGLAGVENLTLNALTVIGLVAALFLRSGHVNVSGFILAGALWAGGTIITWMDFGVREIAAMLPLLGVLIAFLILPLIVGFILWALSIGSIWLLTALELHGLLTPPAPDPVDIGLTLTAIYLLVSLVALVCGQILRRAVRQTLSTQRALSASEKELSSILQRTRDIIYRLDAEGRITFVNDAVRRYGYDPSRMIGTRMIEYVHPEDRHLARHRIDERRADDRTPGTLEVRLLVSRAGEPAAQYPTEPAHQVPVFLCNAEGLYENGTGPEHYVGTQGIARDITDRRRTEEALRKSQEKYAKLFRAAPAGVAVSSMAEGRFLEVNEEFERIFGFSREELIGRSAFALGIWFDDRERERIVDLLRGGGSVEQREAKARAKGGDVRTVRYNAQLIDIDGVACLIFAVVDVTDRKRLESQLQQAQKLEAIGRLAGGIAHDYNNMLAVILGQADLASEALVPGDPAHESIREIRTAAERSAALTRQLLFFTRRQETAPRPLDLNRAISERLGMLRRLIGEDVSLQWNPAPELWTVKIDPVQVDQILVNLVANARDAIAGIGTLTLSTENRLQEVILTVTDTGTGMSRESLAHLFEPFYTTKEVGKGTGMGLATVYGIVQHGGGRIEVESSPGEGTTFRIHLPRAVETATAVHEAEETPFPRGDETLLVVEDEPAMLATTRATLQRLGYAVIGAASAGEALALAAKHEGPLHLLLTDVVMPDMNGPSLAARITAARPGIRVIYMSGNSADLVPPPENGGRGVAFLQKPFTMRQVSIALRDVLDADPDLSTAGDRVVPARTGGIP